MGRTKGAKNRPKEVIQAEREAKAAMPKRGRGRPKGSLNKPKEAPVVEEVVEVRKKAGRPKGRKSGYTVSEKALAQRRAVVPTRKDKVNPTTAEEIAFNARLIDHIMQVHEIATHADRNDINTLKSCFIAYLQLCQKNGFNVQNLTAYAAMGFDNGSFSVFIRKDDPEIREFGRMVKETCAMFREHLVSGNKLNPVIGIFWQRNFDGLRNDTEQVQAAQEQEEDGNYGNSSKEKYKNLIGG